MFSFKYVKPSKKTAATQSPVIDVKQRIAQLSDADLLTAADAYFASLTTDSIQYKKPFSDPAQSIHLAQHLGWLLQAADLFRGARVLDFGCATGWLSLGMAQMGCDVIGVDVAPSALKLAERLKATRRTSSDGRVEFYAYDGHILPLADQSMDRIVCFDAFHHVSDQAATLKEFARVLRPGGRIAFMEPGPNHSKTAESQAEMARFHIIENDVSLPGVATMARTLGLNAPEILVQFQRPMQIQLSEFQRWSEEGIGGKRAKEMLKILLDQMTDAQCFYIQKGDTQLDSRQVASLGAELRLLSLTSEMADGVPVVKLSVAARNTGQGVWITKRNVPGQIKLGIQLLAPDGAMVNLDYDRIELDTPPVEVGQEVIVTGAFRLPSLTGYTFRLDLVSEHVAWFAQLGKAKPLELSSKDFAPK